MVLGPPTETISATSSNGTLRPSPVSISALPADSFMRVHRSYIINLAYVTGYTKGRVFLEGDDYVPIGENYKEQFQGYVTDKF
ncbi:MAG: LytTR family transcriptional regulator [Alistipes sp.]|nr:LytTR family transcriptional regulator [Alistipes sp.]